MLSFANIVYPVTLMPQLPPSTDEQIAQIYQELAAVSKGLRSLSDRLDILAKLMHEQDDDQLRRITALEAALAQLQDKLPATGQATGKTDAIDQTDTESLQHELFGAIAGAEQVQASVDGRAPH